MNEKGKRELLFTVTLDDCDVQYFCSGGPGGQHQNKTETGVRIVHRASGAVEESRSERSQYQNKKIAVKRLAQSGKFRLWARIEAARINRAPSTDDIVNNLMRDKNIIVEGVDELGKWVKLEK